MPVYPQLENTLFALSCPRCHLLQVACLCAKVPVLSSSAVFFLLVHPREISKGSNTGHLILNAFNDADYASWARLEPAANFLALQNSPDHQLYLIFTPDENEREPAPENSVGAPPASSVRRPVYILIDATWQQARKMVRKSAYLKNIPRLSLKTAKASEYRLRRNQLDEGLSTCEAAIGLLQDIGETKNAEQLSEYFQNFMHHFDASMSGHGIE